MANEKTQLEQIIEEAVARKMKPMLWFHAIYGGVILTIFVSIAWPVSEKVIDLHLKIKDVISGQQNFVTEEKAFQSFVTKPLFHRLQKDEHLTDIEAIKNPDDAELIYEKHNNVEADRLQVGYRGESSN